MALYAIGDLHLSLTTGKSMEVFGPAWENYVERIRAALEPLEAEDALVLAGDISWGMSLEEAEADFRFLDAFPCRKLLIKGNHDYWWTTGAKMRRFFQERGFTTFRVLRNNCAFYGDYALCGSRGWFWEEERKAQNVKVLNREVLRLEASCKAAGERPILGFLHYPPVYQGYRCPELLSVLERFHVARCCYGHLHGAAIRRRLEGTFQGTEYALISADYLGFVPKKILEEPGTLALSDESG